MGTMLPLPGADPSGALGALVLGAVAGLAVAMPVGPVALLVVREGMTRGARAGLTAGAGVAAVDAAYAALAAAAGVEVARVLAAHESGLRITGAAVLAAVGLVGLLRWWTSRRPGRSSSEPTSGSAAPASGGRGAWSTWARFVALTVANPLTALVLATVAVGLGGRLAPGAAAGVAFAVGAGGASLAWQSGLALTGAWLGGRTPGRWQELSAPAGAALVVVLAAVVALR